MHSNWHRAVLVSLLMIFTSLAGCIESSDSGDKEDENYGTIMTSTYHVEQLVSAIVGDTATVETMSTTNIPVHDYTPSLIDIERLKSSDVFFYHGLELEPWVDATLSSEGVPPSYMTHTMPTGEITLDFQTMLVNALCEQLSTGDKVSNDLLSYEDQAGQLEIHLDEGTQTLTFPPVDTVRMEHVHEDDDHDEDGHDDGDHDEDGHDDGDHDEDGHDEDGHDDGDHDEDGHDEDGHDDGHDNHEGHAHAEAEMVIENPVNCPANTVISVFHLEEGEHVIEFETKTSTITSFDIAALPMMGGHAHHDHHGHGEEGHDEHGVCHDMSDHTNNSIDNKAECESSGYTWMEESDGHDSHGHDDEMTAESAMAMGDVNNDSNMSWGEIWTLLNSEDDHDEDGHDEDGHDEEGSELMMPYFMTIFNESDADMNQLLDMGELENFIEAVDSMEDDDMSTELVIALYDTDGDGGLSFEEFNAMFMLTNDDDHDGHGHDDGDHDEDGHDEDGHDDGDHDEDGHDDNETSMEDLMEQMMQLMMQEMFNEMDVNNDSILDAEELKALNSMGEDHEDPVCHDPVTHLDTEHTDRASCEAAGNIWIIGEPNDGTRGYLTIHVENEGDYGFAMPSDISVFLLMSEGHEDHGDHGDGGHDDHEDDGEGNHDDHEGEEDSTLAADEGEDFEYDPHSWLDPIAFKAQTQLVLSALIEVFPDGAETFTANAEAFMAELDKVHLEYIAAFGPDGTCANKTAAANHNAYSYITERYGVQFVTVHGLDPEGQPSVQDIERVISKINEDEISVLFIEEYTQSSSVDVIVESTDVEVMYLYTMEKSPSDTNDDYLSMLNKNLDNLKTGLVCAV